MYHDEDDNFDDSVYNNVYEENMYDDRPYTDPKDLTPQGEMKAYYQDKSGHLHPHRISSYYDAPDDPDKAAEWGYLTVQDVIAEVETEGDYESMHQEYENDDDDNLKTCRESI